MFKNIQTQDVLHPHRDSSHHHSFGCRKFRKSQLILYYSPLYIFPYIKMLKHFGNHQKLRVVASIF